MKYLVEQVERKKNEQVIHTIKLEIDYELLTLYDAMEMNNDEEIKDAKLKLSKLVKKLYLLNKLSTNA
ncbi:MAG TPA: hypothetical protein H9895_10855 [Candidatus Pseudogracilibacillus intestinigallinarum]|uniref:Uncharacterized protein n=1 Tax=Candidatus Pseudogracilibacillus intestinigallinarum TaxID=2838742 RepID=A0A9D1PQ92_9BACI|nr:hypothetical protein [Candidatus Pseudogracilibacillus intestinigallinarum]